MAETKDVRLSLFEHRWFRLALIVLVVLTAVVFQGVLWGEFLRYDDDTYVLKNPLIHPLNLQTVGKMFTRTYFRSYTPLTHLSHAADLDIWGANPFGHHLLNYVLHLLNTALVFCLAAGMILYVKIRPPEGAERPWKTLSEGATPPVFLGALFAAAFFALHPLRVESVAWISDRKDLLMTFFALLSFLSYLGFRLGSGRPGSRRWYLASVVSGILAMLAKTVASVIPIVFLLADLLVFELSFRGSRGRKRILEKAPLFAGAALVGVASILAVGKILPHPRVLQRTVVEEVLAPFYTWAFYIVKTLYPGGLSPLYAFPDVWMLCAGVVATVSVTVIVVILARRAVRVPLFAWGFYTLVVLPTILARGPAGIQSWADRYSYIPGVAISVVLGGGVVWLMERLKGTMRWVAAGSLGFVLAALCILTIRQVPVWHDTVSLFTCAVEQNPRVIMAHTNLGNALTNAGRPDEAIASLERAVALNDRFAGAYQYLGLAYELKGDHRRAEGYYQKALALDSNMVEAYSNLGNALLAQGLYDRAIEQYTIAIRKDPEFSDPYYNLGVATYMKGDTLAAMDVFRTAADMNPNSADTYVSMGIIYSDRGMEDSAYVQYAKAAELGHPQARELVRRRGR